MRVDTIVMRRDMEYFLVMYAVAITASFLGGHPVIKTFIAVSLFLIYGCYVLKSLKAVANLKHTRLRVRNRSLLFCP